VCGEVLYRNAFITEPLGYTSRPDLGEAATSNDFPIRVVAYRPEAEFGQKHSCLCDDSLSGLPSGKAFRMVLQGEADIVPRAHMTYSTTSDSEGRTGLASRYSSSINRADMSKGRFSIAQAPSGWSIVRYELSPDRMGFMKDPQVVALAATGGIELLRVNGRDDILTIFPVNTFPDGDDFLQPKYDRIQAISVEGFQIADPQSPEDVAMILEGLPSGFIKDPEYGLGLQKDFRFIIHAIEEIKTLTKLMVTERRPSSVEGDTYVLNYRDFEAVRKGINRAHNNAVNAAFVDKRILAHNALLTSLLPDTYPKKHSPYKKDTIFKAGLIYIVYIGV
jgi:hypothetical protein